MSISNPTQLVEEFKKSGEFDRLRRELLAEFQKGDHMAGFSQKIEDVVMRRLNSDKDKHRFGRFGYFRDSNSLEWKKGSGYLKNELNEEIERYPYVENAVNGMSTFSDPAFQSNIRDSVHRILREDKDKLSPVEHPRSGKPTEKLLIDNDSDKDVDKLKSITPSSAEPHSDTAANPINAADLERHEETSQSTEHTPSDALKQPVSLSPPKENGPSAELEEEEQREKVNTVVAAQDIVMEDVAAPPETTLPTPDDNKLISTDS